MNNVKRQGVVGALNPIGQLFFAFMAWLAITGLFWLLAMVFAMPIFNIGMHEVMGALGNLNESGDPALLKYFQVVNSVGSFVVSPFVIAFLINRNAVGYLSLNRGIRAHHAFLVAHHQLFNGPEPKNHRRTGISLRFRAMGQKHRGIGKKTN